MWILFLFFIHCWVYTILKLWIYQTIIIDLWTNVISEMLFLQQKVCEIFIIIMA